MKNGDIIEGKYQLVRLLGEGGMGAVWEGRHTRIGRRCALKFLHAELNRNTDVVARFLREAQAAAAIGSEHIVDVTDVGETEDGYPYLVMEYLEGEDLASVLQREGPLEPTRVARLVVQAARAVAAAHGRGIIHRDLKPENLFLVRKEDGLEWVKVLDFGIAKFRDSIAEHAPNLTATGTVLGTPYYMAPEQARGAKDLDEQADVYSTGVILYELLAGEPPFTAQSYNELIVLIATTDPRPLRMMRPDVPEPLERVVQTAMARDRSRRYRTMRQLVEALATVAGDSRDALPRTVEGPRVGPGLSGPQGRAAGTPAGGSLGPGTVTSGGDAVGAGPELDPASWPGAGEEPGRRRRSWLPAVLGAVAVVLAAGGVALVMASDRAPAPAARVVLEPPAPLPSPEPPVVPAGLGAGAATDPADSSPASPETVQLEVRVEPPGAVIRVDGIEVESNPFSGRFPRDGARHRVEASLNGHRDSGQFVVFDQDRAVEITLRPVRGGQPGTTRTDARPDPPRGDGRGIDRNNPYGGAE